LTFGAINVCAAALLPDKAIVVAAAVADPVSQSRRVIFCVIYMLSQDLKLVSFIEII
jgi:hypothetical protein